MHHFVGTFRAEMTKQNLNYFNSASAYVFLFLLPVLVFFVTLYTYQVFDLSHLRPYGINSRDELVVFLVSGSLGYYCFFSMVESALYIQSERENGTLEMVFLTPASRMGLLYGRALGGLIQNMWMYSAFSLLIMLASHRVSVGSLLKVPLAFAVVVVASTVWGGFINAIFLTTRDVNFWFVLTDEPMRLLSGTIIPVAAFPAAVKAVSAVFPLTYCLIVVRALLGGSSEGLGWTGVLVFALSLSVVVLLTFAVTILAERHNRKTGSLQLY